MPVNVEIKARVADLAAVRSRVVRTATAGPWSLTQVDTFFAATHGRLKLREAGDGGAELICYERPDAAGPRASTYLLAPIPHPAALRSVLSAALTTRVVVRKRRELYMVGQTRVHLDAVEGLGTFVELEVVLRPDQQSQDGERIARELMTELGVSADNLVPVAYADLLEARSTQETAIASTPPPAARTPTPTIRDRASS